MLVAGIAYCELVEVPLFSDKTTLYLRCLGF